MNAKKKSVALKPREQLALFSYALKRADAKLLHALQEFACDPIHITEEREKIASVLALTPEGITSQIVELRAQLAAAEGKLAKLETLATKVDAIRNSIVGCQGFNFSEHAYPLVAALKEAGYEGQGYEIASKNLGTCIERAVSAEKRAETAESQLARIFAQSTSHPNETGLRVEYHEDDNRLYVYSLTDGSFKWSGDAWFNAVQCVKLTDDRAQLWSQLAAERAASQRLRDALGQCSQERAQLISGAAQATNMIGALIDAHFDEDPGEGRAYCPEGQKLRDLSAHLEGGCIDSDGDYMKASDYNAALAATAPGKEGAP